MISKKRYEVKRVLVSILLLFLIFSLLFITFQVVKASPTIKVIAIKFEGTYEYQLSDRGVLITDPVWTGDLLGNITKNRPACYRKNSQMTIKADIDGSGITLPVQVKVTLSANFGGYTIIPSTTKTFTVNNWSNQDYTNLTFTSNYLFNYICHYYDIPFNWSFQAYINGSWVSMGSQTTHHTIYTTFSTPISISGMQYLWVETIKQANIWANYASTTLEVSSKITDRIYNSGLWYDGSRTHSEHPYSTFHLSWFLNDWDWGDCQDFSNFYSVLCRNVGVDAKSDLIERQPPYYYPIHTKEILPVLYLEWQNFSWDFHQVGWLVSTGKVYDPTIKVNQSSPLIPMNLIRDSEYKGYLYDSGSWNPQNPSYFSYID